MLRLTTDEVAHLLGLAESGRLDPDALRACAPPGALRPHGSDWRALLDRVLGFGGALLLAAAVIFFFAYNWDDLHRHAKFGLAFAGLAIPVALALRAQPYAVAFRAALLGACVATGALLALIGQTYQTGADMWMLFAAWAALMTPFAVLSRSAASWTLWMMVVNVALMRALSQSIWFPLFGPLGHSGALAAIATLNLALLLVFELAGGRLLSSPGRALPRLAALIMFVALVFGAMLGFWDGALRPMIAYFAIAAALAGYVYVRLRRDLMILAVAVYGAIAVLSAGLVKILPSDAFLIYNLIGIVVMAASGAAGMWLTRLHRRTGDHR